MWRCFSLISLCRSDSGIERVRVSACRHGQTFSLLHFGYTLATLLGQQIKGRGRGNQPFPNKMKYHWPKVSIQPPLKRVVCWVGYSFLRIEGKFCTKCWFDSRPLKRVVCWVGYPFSSVEGHHCSLVLAAVGSRF